MPNTVRLSGDTGVLSGLSDFLISNPKSLLFDFVGNCITVVPENGAPVQVALTGVTTVTDSITANVHTIVIDK